MNIDLHTFNYSQMIALSMIGFYMWPFLNYFFNLNICLYLSILNPFSWKKPIPCGPINYVAKQTT